LTQLGKLYGGYDKLPPFEKAIYDCHTAEILFEQSDYAKAFSAYSKIFASHSTMLRNQFHHFARWIELAIILEKYDEASRLLDSIFKVYVDNCHESNGVIGSTLYAELYLASGKLDEAFTSISHAKSLNSLQVYFHHEIRIRLLETIYFAYSGDFEFVRRLAQRNMRYIQLQKLSLKKFKYARCFHLMKELKNVRNPVQPKLISKAEICLKEFDSGYDKLIGILLRNLWNFILAQHSSGGKASKKFQRSRR